MEMATRSPTREAVVEVLKTCYDPCCRDRQISVVDMGLIEAVHVNGGAVRVDMVLTSGWCPFSVHMLTMMDERLRQMDGVGEVDIQIVWNPVWSPDRMSESARKKLMLPLEKLQQLREQRLAVLKGGVSQ